MRDDVSDEGGSNGGGFLELFRKQRQEDRYDFGIACGVRERERAEG